MEQAETPPRATGFPDDIIVARHHEHQGARAALIGEHRARFELAGLGHYADPPESGDLEQIREHTAMLRASWYANREAARVHQLATTPPSPRSEPADPPRSLESAARALTGAARRLSNATVDERLPILEWALRKPGREALRSGWDHASITELLVESAEAAGIDGELARATVFRELVR